MNKENEFKDFTKRMDSSIANAKRLNQRSVYGVKILETGVVMKKTIDASRVLNRYVSTCKRLGIDLKFRKSTVASRVGKISYVADATW